MKHVVQTAFLVAVVASAAVFLVAHAPIFGTGVVVAVAALCWYEHRKPLD